MPSSSLNWVRSVKPRPQRPTGALPAFRTITCVKSWPDRVGFFVAGGCFYSVKSTIDPGNFFRRSISPRSALCFSVGRWQPGSLASTPIFCDRDLSFSEWTIYQEFTMGVQGSDVFTTSIDAQTPGGATGPSISASLGFLGVFACNEPHSTPTTR